MLAHLGEAATIAGISSGSGRIFTLIRTVTSRVLCPPADTSRAPEHQPRALAAEKQRRRAVPPQVSDDVLGGSQVAAHAAEGLGEGAHHHVDVSSVYTEEFSNPPTARPHRADRVRFVEIQISPILLLERDDFPQATEVALHGVDALHEHDDLAPRLHSGIRINVALGGLRVCKSNKT